MPNARINHMATAPSDTAELESTVCMEQTRRTLLFGALAATACCAASRRASAEDDQPGADERPQKGDLLVFSEGDREGSVVTLADLPLGGPPVHAWPKDPKTSVVRSGSRLNEILIIHLDPASLDDQTRSRATDGIVAYSAICTHAGCPVTAWVKSDVGDREVLKCMCHNSEYDPREGAQVVFGPAPRRLAALVLALNDGALTVAGPFIGKVGGVQQG